MEKTPEDYVAHIRDTGFYNLNQEDINLLANCSQSFYSEIVRKLLNCSISNVLADGIKAYQPRVDACNLYIFRPDLILYQNVLAGALDIPNPSVIRIGSVALTQIKSADDVSLDLLSLVRPNWENDERLSSIFALFYWLGFTAKGLLGENGRPIGFPEKFIPLMKLLQDYERPRAAPKKAEKVSIQTIEQMIEIVEQKDVGQASRSCIALLTLIDPNHYLVDLRRQIVNAYRKAQSSSDPYMKNRVSSLEIKEMIDDIAET